MTDFAKFFRNGVFRGMAEFLVNALNAVLPSISGNASKALKVNAGETGVEWVAVSTTTTQVISFTFDGGGVVLPINKYVDWRAPYAGTFTKWTIVETGDIASSCSLGVWKDTYTNYPPTIADSIAASAKPTLTAAFKNQDSTLTGWTTAFVLGDIIRVNLDSNDVARRLQLFLELTTA